MFIGFFHTLRKGGMPVGLTEFLGLLDAMDKKVTDGSVDNFYYLSRAVFVKHENQLDLFDKLFGAYFDGINEIDPDLLQNIPEDWLRKNLKDLLTPEEWEKLESMGGPEALMERFRELMEEQNERHEGGNKWIGTGGTSPFGAYGYNPEGFRMGQDKSRHRRAVKVWDKRSFADLDDSVELNTRSMKMALKKLRVLTREGKADELDIDKTIRQTSDNAGMLDIAMRPSRRNRVNVLLLLDIGGSMDDHVEMCSRLFSAARYEFKHLEYYYFHNCLYEYVWKNNRRRWSERIPTFDLINKFNSDYKVIFVGDAAMSPYEIAAPGGSVEHNNAEPGVVWLQRIQSHFNYVSWINPNPIQAWTYYQSTGMLRELFNYRMFPLSIGGIKLTVKSLKDRSVTYRLERKKR